MTETRFLDVGKTILYTYVDKNGVDVISTVVALEGRDVRPEVVSWKEGEMI